MTEVDGVRERSPALPRHACLLTGGSPARRGPAAERVREHLPALAAPPRRRANRRFSSAPRLWPRLAVGALGLLVAGWLVRRLRERARTRRVAATRGRRRTGHWCEARERYRRSMNERLGAGDVVRAYLRVFETGKVDEFETLVAEDVECWGANQHLHGREWPAGSVDNPGLSSCRLEILELFEAGSRVTVYFRSTYRHDATGRDVEQTGL